jgi:hypothetical protein
MRRPTRAHQENSPITGNSSLAQDFSLILGTPDAPRLKDSGESNVKDAPPEGCRIFHVDGFVLGRAP